MNIKESIGVGSFHFIGIGGVGMAAMANILMDLGADVSGTDLVESNNS
ncbi:MAG: Mur ligase domain-containing protein, partial [Lentisphaeria bacterium]